MLVHFVDFMNRLPSLPIFLAIVVVVEPILVLMHELGHAAAAIIRRPGPVVVRVGAERPLFEARLGRIQLRLHPLVLPWRFDGQCIYETDAQTRADAVVIALAGPATSIGCGLLSWFGMQAVSGTSFLHVVLQVATFLAIGSGLICLIPLTLRDSRGMRARTDGAQALAAFSAT